MEWKISVTTIFEAWWETLSDDTQDECTAVIELLEQAGPRLGRPYCDSVEGSKHSNMKELRIQYAGHPYRILFAFDPNRAAILLVGGCKQGDKRWYKKHLPQADRLFDEHLSAIEMAKGASNDHTPLQGTGRGFTAREKG